MKYKQLSLDSISLEAQQIAESFLEPIWERMEDGVQDMMGDIITIAFTNPERIILERELASDIQQFHNNRMSDCE